MISDVIERGGKLLTGGVRGGVVPPTVSYNPPSDADIGRHEACEPLVAVYPVDTLADAVAAANSLEFGLMTGIFTSSLETATTLVDALEAGDVPRRVVS